MKANIHITLMRHGRSCADDENVYEGRYDAPLTETGRAQAESRAREFLARNLGFTRITASTLLRAHETAKIMGQVLNVPVTTDPDWMELDAGMLTGLPRAVADTRYPKPSFRNPYEPTCITGESAWELYCRGARAVEKVIRQGTGNYLVVAHGCILNAALRTIIGSQPSVNEQGIVFGFGDTGFARFVYYPAVHVWQLLEFKAG